MGKTERLMKALKEQGGVFGPEASETKEVAVATPQLLEGMTPLPQWGLPPSEEKAIERIGSYRIKGLEQYYKMGKTLIWLKENQYGHGEWGNYLKNRVDLDERSAQRFMAFAKRADDLGYLPSTLVEQKSLPGKAQKAKTTQVSDLDQTPKALQEEVKSLKAQAREVEKRAEEERKAREQIEKNLEAEREATEKAEKLVQEAQEKVGEIRPEIQAEKPLEPRGTIEPFVVELGPGFKREEINKALVAWFWRGQGKVKSTRKQVTLYLKVQV